MPAPVRNPNTVSEPAGASAESKAYGTFAPDCEALFVAWQRDWVGEGEAPDPEVEAELRERSSKFPCELEIDLDGDHNDERIFITGVGSDRVVGLGIEWGAGERTLLGGGSPVEMQPGIEGEDDPIVISEFGWLVHWKPAPLREGEYEVMVLGKPVRFDAPGALGDGIEVSGSDAAAIIYFDGEAWRWVHLGF